MSEFIKVFDKDYKARSLTVDGEFVECLVPVNLWDELKIAIKKNEYIHQALNSFEFKPQTNPHFYFRLAHSRKGTGLLDIFRCWTKGSLGFAYEHYLEFEREGASVEEVIDYLKCHFYISKK